MADPVALDLLNGSVVGQDGFVDHIFVGDIGGNFYTIRLNFTGSSGQGMWIDTRLTRSVPESGPVSPAVTTNYSNYRGVPQPITTAASVSLDAVDQTYVRAIVGAGKYRRRV